MQVLDLAGSTIVKLTFEGGSETSLLVPLWCMKRAPRYVRSFLPFQCLDCFRPKQDANIFENHLNPAMLVFIG